MPDYIALISTDPLDIVPKATYPSGAKDEHNPIYLWGYDSTENPIVRIPYSIKDNAGFSASPGIYEVIISNEQNYFLLVQSKRLILKVPIVKLEQIETVADFSSANISKKKKKSKKKQKEFQGVIDEAKKQAKLKATLTDSKKGYFILFYKTEKIKAYGYIPY